MAKHKMRWRDSDTAELQRTIRNFNAKIYRLRKLHPEMIDYLPDTVKKKDLMKSIDTRQDYKRKLKSLQGFSKRGAEELQTSKRGAKATKWEIKEVNKDVRRANIERAKRREALEAKEVTSRGQPTGMKRGQMGSIKENAVKPRKASFDNKSQKEWDLFKQGLDKELDKQLAEEAKARMKENYKKALEQYGFDDVSELLDDIDADTFLETVDTDTEAAFDFIYDPIEAEIKRKALAETWKAAKNKSKG